MAFSHTSTRLAPNHVPSRPCAAITVARSGAMTAAQQAAFQAGSGITPATMLTSIASMVLVLAFVWVIWFTFGVFRAWQEGQATVFDLTWSTSAGKHCVDGVGFLFAVSQSRKPGKGKRRRIAVGCGDRPPVLSALQKRTFVMGTSTTKKRVQQSVGIAIRRPLLATAAVFFPLPLWAALPTPVAPSTAPAVRVTGSD
jgi:integrating conjugative element protein (TIGR03758 family)